MTCKECQHDQPQKCERGYYNAYHRDLDIPCTEASPKREGELTHTDIMEGIAVYNTYATLSL